MKPPRDKYCCDGIISDGERKVRNGGRLSFGGYLVTDEKLIPWIGKKVFVTVEDYFFINVMIFDAEDYTRFICKSKIMNPTPTKESAV